MVKRFIPGMSPLEKLSTGSILDELAKCVTKGNLEKKDEQLASIKGFQAVFKKLVRNPAMIRLLLQAEFHFTGQVSVFDKDAKADDLLKAEWFDSTFVIPDYGQVERWLAKAASENKKGKTIVGIVPARTNTNWFHERILEGADEVRFIQGRITMPGFKTQSAYADAIFILKGENGTNRRSVQPRPQNEVGLIHCTTSITSMDTSMGIVDEKED